MVQVRIKLSAQLHAKSVLLTKIFLGHRFGEVSHMGHIYILPYLEAL